MDKDLHELDNLLRLPTDKLSNKDYKLQDVKAQAVTLKGMLAGLKRE